MTFGFFSQLYDSMINAGSTAFMAVSNGVTSTYEKSETAMLFCNYLYLEILECLIISKNKQEKWQKHGKSKCSNQKHALWVGLKVPKQVLWL